jgi:hypothetical protein
MHPEINRELSRVQHQEALRRQARSQAAMVSDEAAMVSAEAAVERASRPARRRAALSPLRLMARLQPRGH